MRQSSIGVSVVTGAIIYFFLTSWVFRLIVCIGIVIGVIGYFYDDLATERTLAPTEAGRAYDYSFQLVTEPDFQDPSQNRKVMRFAVRGNVQNKLNETIQRYDLVTDFYDCQDPNDTVDACRLIKHRVETKGDEIRAKDTSTFLHSMVLYDDSGLKGYPVLVNSLENVIVDEDSEGVPQRGIVDQRYR